MISYHTMVQSYIFLLVTVTSIIWKMSLGLSCLSCHSESDKSRCSTHQVQCREGFEECFFDKSTLQNSAVVYSAGCRAKAVCDLLENAVGKRDVIGRSRRTSVLCAQCCNTASRNNIPCNAHLCDNRMFCLSCHSESDKSKCLTHQIECRDGLEECFFDKITLQNSAVVYSAGCREKAVCDLVGNAVGKRDVISRSRRTSVLCAQCCNTPPRNSLPCNAQLCEDRFTTDTSTPGHFTDYNQNDCKDLINCRPYPKESICPASSSYHAWANVRCKMYCGFCIVSTPPPSCVDKISNCNEYDADLCTNPLYRLFKEDNCQLFCGLCKIAATIPSTTPPTPVPTTTMKIPFRPPTTIGVQRCTQWDNWVNLHTPDASGDSEPIAEVKKHSHICINPMKIECRTATGSTADDLGQIISCDLWSGLQCDNMNQFDPNGCADYKVRLGCLKQTSECTPCVDRSWSPWVDERNPTTHALGDKEKSGLEYQKASGFCSGGTIHKVECWSTDIGAFHYSIGQVMKCTPIDGVVCNNADNYPLTCTNYKIRYQCYCNVTTILHFVPPISRRDNEEDGIFLL
ncbi:uncharacterized protein LOC134681842 isoform X2 [Mytilus trossulus]|uniref:uncharacterized protein LOC134681842 isoform X2 n=1 Tax=Mytilus trossulus TaxID=6551 RepID=UPI003003F462